MPSLRDSGKIVASPVSIRQLAISCGLPFPLSLRQLIATPCCPFTHWNRLHIKVLTSPTLPSPSIETMLMRMREVYSTAGIGVIVVSRENLTPAVMGNATFNALNDLDTGTCTAGNPSAEQIQLFAFQNGVPAGQRNNEIVVYFVSSAFYTGGAANGCASHPAGQPGAAIASYATQWTLAHEVGHVLDLSHIPGEDTACPASDPHCCSTPDFTRLMTGCGTAGITGTPVLAASEMATMLASNLSRPC